MGKTVLAIVGVAAAIGIAIAAPYLGGLLATAVFGATATATAVAIATALVTVALSVAVGLAFRALGVGAPSAKDATLAPQGTAVVAMFAFPFTSEYALEPVMPAVRGSRMGRLIFGRWRIHELHGFCMGPEFTGFAIIDVDADIRRGDLFSFSTRDFKTAWPEAQTAAGINGAVKQFHGINREHGIIECSCREPSYTIHTGTTNLTRAWRVRAVAPSYWRAVRLLWRIRRDPDAFDVPLMA